MTIKQKFSSIDQSKLTADQKAFLDKIKNVTKNFTDAEMNKKVETPLDNFIAKAKDKMPEAIKSAPVKKTTKAKTSQTKKPKRTAMSLAKEIRKEGESWKDAQARARKMMKEDSQSLSKTVESELDKLTKLVRSQKVKDKLVGISGTDIKRDAVRKAKPRGARKVTRSGETSNQYGTYKNHLGRKYYESRDEHSDRLAPRYPKNAPLLAEGGYLTDPTFGTFQNQVFAEGGDIDAFTLRMVKSNGMQPAEVLKEDANVKYNRGGSVTNERRYVNKGEDYEVRYSRPILRRKGYQGKRDFMVGGRVESLIKELHRLQRELNSSRLQTYRLGDNSQEAMDRKNEREVKLARFNEVLKELRESDAKFELGGVMTTDLAGHTGGGTGGLNAGMPLDGFSNTSYTGLVGETGAMSSGEMFMSGGSIDKNFDLSGYKKFRTFNDLEEAKQYVDMDRKKYPRVKESVVIKEGNRFQVWVVPATGIETGNRVYELGGGLPSGVSQSYMITESLGNPAQHFAKGGGVKTINGREYSYGRNWTNDHRHVNQDEEHEVKYTRKGKFLGIFNNGGALTNERKHVNHDEDYEVRYAKPRPHRKGYKGVRGFNKGGALTNERKHVNHDEDYEVRYSKPRPKRKGYKGARKFMAGGSMETPKIYVADLEAYNNGRLSGVWLDLADYNDADELMEAIQDFLKTSGGEEYAIHDVEYVPRSMYSEYMGQKDFEELYEMIDLAKENDLPLEVVQEVVSQFGEFRVDFQGRYDNAEDFAEQLVDKMGGLENFSSPEYYVDITDTDRRLLAGEMADSYVDDIRDEDGGNRVIEEAGLDLDEYEEADSERREEMVDEAVEIVREEYYDTWYEGLSDPYEFLVEEQGMYSPEDLFNASFIRIDYEKLARDLEQDYTFIYEDGELYVFNIR